VIAKIMKGGGFRGAADYLMRAGRDEPAGIIIAGNMVALDGRGLAAEFKVARQLRPDVGKPVWHASLALPPGQSLNNQEWEKAARVFMEEMGLNPESHQWTAIRHDDREHQHIHILASRISVTTGKLARERRGDYKLSHAAARKAAAAVGLPPTDPPPAHQRRASLRRGELSHAERVTGSPHRHPKLQLASRLDEALARSNTLDELVQRAEELGVEVKYSSNAGGIYGVSYRLANPAEREGFAVEWVKGSQVGKAYTISSITRRLAGELDIPTSRRGQRVRQDILQRLNREKQDQKEILRWTNGYVAAVATSNEIRWRTGSAAEAAVCAALAKEKGWAEMILADRGSDEKNRAAVEAYIRQGISVQLAGQRYPAPASAVTKQEFSHGHDGRDPRESKGRSGTAAPIPGAVEVDGGSSQRSPQEDQRPDSTTRPAAPLLPISTGAAGQAAKDGERNRPDAEKAATGATHEGEDMEDILDFLDESPAIQARDAAALEELAAAKPGDHNLQLLAGELEVEEKKTGGAEGAGSASAPRAPAPAVPAPPAIASAGTGVREEEEDRAVLEEIEAQLQDIYQESDWQAYWQQLPRREYRIQRDEAMPYAAARALALGHRREAVARVAGEKATARAEKHVADPAKRAATQQKAAGAKVRVDQNRQAEDKRLAEKAKDWANQKPKSKEGWKK
jgi:hypothetical protein